MKYLMMILAMVVLGSCGDKEKPQLIVERPVVFVPNEALFQCPTVSEFPDPATLTDEDVAELLVRLDTYNRTCANSLSAVRRQLLDAKARLEQQ